eukprot:GEMP01011487.1.p1 GENE.GEMP01011487.1~~GEMP01011487.1.p1  ORF type:complete len:998 (+),score=166.87 GEMP01011487.1:91-3084(+)
MHHDAVNYNMPRPLSARSLPYPPRPRSLSSTSTPANDQPRVTYTVDEPAVRDRSSRWSFGNRSSRSSDGGGHSEVPKITRGRALVLWKARFRAACRRVVEVARTVILSSTFSNFTTLLTVYALFGDDIRVAWTPQSMDTGFNVCTAICLVIFSTELLAFSAFRDDYVFGFFFWLDLVATVSLVTDITTVNESLFEQDHDDGSAMTRAGRAGRVGTKAARIVRIIRLVRLVRIVKLYKSVVFRFSKKKDQEQEDLLWDDYPDEAMMNQSRVSKKLSELTSKRVIMIVLGMLFCTPVFDYKTWEEDSVSSAQYGADLIHNLFMSNKWDAADAMAIYLLFHAPHEPKPWSSWAGAANIFYVGYHKDENPWTKPSAMGEDEWRNNTQSYVWSAWDPPIGNMNYEKKDLFNNWGTNVCDEGIYGMHPYHGVDDSLDSVCYRDQLRFSERENVVAADVRGRSFVFVFDKREMTQTSGKFNILLTLFVCLVLGMAALGFSRITNTLVLEPIERIMKMMQAIRQNPLEAIYMGEEDSATCEAKGAENDSRLSFCGLVADFVRRLLGGRHSTDQDEKQISKNSPQSSYQTTHNWSDGMTSSSTLLGNKLMMPASWKQVEKEKKLPETLILEKTILKIGSLLVLGFGEAGAEIIGENLKESQLAGSNSQVAIVPGRRVEAAFLYCDIRNFTEVTEVLQDKVMVFVNQIAGIIHEVVDHFGGYPNKNIGDAFLCVWRFPISQEERTKIANMALVCPIQIVAKIQSSKILAQYRTHEGLIERLPNYQVCLGFGLHFGWAIEGAIGSAYKIDASYLSENVTMATRLEAATRHYDVILVVSQSFVDHISPELHAVLRLIDHVYFRGTRQPQKLYTMDIESDAIQSAPLDEFEMALFSVNAKRRKSRAAIKRRHRRTMGTVVDVRSILWTDPDLLALRRRYDRSNQNAMAFLHQFHAAFFNYEAGEWLIAQQMLKQVRNVFGYDDGPSRALSAYMQQYDNIAPPNWAGYRFL